MLNKFSSQWRRALQTESASGGPWKNGTHDAWVDSEPTADHGAENHRGNFCGCLFPEISATVHATG